MCKLAFNSIYFADESKAYLLCKPFDNAHAADAARFSRGRKQPHCREHRNTSPFDVLGLPAISIPCGFTTSGLPVGLQIVGAPFAESTVLILAHAYEMETQWHKRHPRINRD